LFIKKAKVFLLSTFVIISILGFPQITVKAASFNGWRLSGTTWNYYINGNKTTGWRLINCKWYYFNASGDMVIGWEQFGTRFNQTGTALSTTWYYLNPNGDMAIGWLLINRKWYYLNPDGKMATGWKLINGKWYYFNANGDMAECTITPDGNLVGYDGTWMGKAKVLTQEESNTIVTFPDKNLEKEIRTQINKPTGEIIKGDLVKITRLAYRGDTITGWYPISNLSGIENVINLTYLNLMENEISNIDALNELTNLSFLNLMNNQITNIDVLKGLTNLTGLYLGHNQIKDYSPTSSYYNNLKSKGFILP
jgi:hypothetical protein